MVIDTSALIAILQGEMEMQSFLTAIDRDDNCMISSVTLFEAGMISLSRRKDAGERELDDLVSKSGAKIVPFNEKQASIARRAFRKYGKGRHAAGLNFGDCMSYALAKDTGEPLLFKGTDFDKTDIRPVIIE